MRGFFLLILPFLAIQAHAQTGEYETITEFAVVNNDTSQLNMTPPPADQYMTIFETVIVFPEYTDYTVTPATFEWIDGEHAGETTVMEYVPAELERVIEIVTVEEATTELIPTPPTCQREADGSITITGPADFSEIFIPAVTEEQEFWKMVAPPSVKAIKVANVIKDGKTRVVSSPAKVTKFSVPAKTQMVPRRVVNSPWCPGEILIPAGEREVTCRLSKRTMVSN